MMHVSGRLFLISVDGAVGRAVADGYCSSECTRPEVRDGCSHGNMVCVCVKGLEGQVVCGVKGQIIYLCIR